MKKTIFTATLLCALTGMNCFADETVKAKAEEVGNDTKRGLKKTYRTVKEKTCSMVKGKMECAGEKVKHTIQNTGDSVEDAVD